MTPARTHPQVVVVGAGVAGLSAASLLAEHGLPVLVLEARGRLGGRATSLVDRHTGERVDNGQHVLLGCYAETFAFLARVGADRLVRLQEALEIPFVDAQGRRSLLSCPPWPSPLHLVGGVFRWGALSYAERFSLLRLVPALWRARRLVARAEADRRSVDDPRSLMDALSALVRPAETVDAWLRRHGQSERLRELLWEPLAVAALNQDVRLAGALPFVRVLGSIFGPKRRHAAIALPTAPLDDVFGEPARRYVEDRGGEVRLHALARIAVAEGRVASVSVRDTSVSVPNVIAAVPWFDLDRLVVGPGRDAIASVLASASAQASSPIVTVNLWFDRPVLDTPFLGLPGRTMQWVFDKRAVFGGNASHLSLVSSGADAVLRLPDQELVRLAVDEVGASIPPARQARLLNALVVREPKATFALSPGQPARPDVATPVAGLWLAGDWTETGLPGTIEGAAVSGHRAALHVLRQIGIS